MRRERFSAQPKEAHAQRMERFCRRQRSATRLPSRVLVECRRV
jgi:hypothetical protein